MELISKNVVGTTIMRIGSPDVNLIAQKVGKELIHWKMPAKQKNAKNFIPVLAVLVGGDTRNGVAKRLHTKVWFLYIWPIHVEFRMIFSNQINQLFLGCKFQSVPSDECPSGSSNLPDCTSNMIHGELCAIDLTTSESYIRNLNDLSLNGCDGVNVFKCTRVMYIIR